ncbi:MAG: malto-oligosyltrehalose synthase [Candidatus Gastranaerophilales bacterium]|nr:malto-oligosyltrehalose synthase [Candidatus Gastranaerophilales bacterium]
MNYAANEKIGIVGVGSVNQQYFYDDKTSVNVPTSRIMFNTLLIDTDEAIKFVGDKQIHMHLLTKSFQAELKKLQEAETIDFQAIHKLKTKVFRVIYKSFREHHIAKNTEKSRDFFNYVATKGEIVRKVALFEALKEYFTEQNSRLADWHEWSENYKDPNSDDVTFFESKNAETIQFYEFIQWLADIQLGFAGRTSWVNRLNIGLYSEIGFFIPYDSAESWLKQNYYAFKAGICLDSPEDNSSICAPMIPCKLKEDGYSYITEILRSNMIHSGAIGITNLQELEKQCWYSKQNSDTRFYVHYPLEDLLGIIALESHRNKCLVLINITDGFPAETREKIANYGFLQEKDFDIKELSPAELSNFIDNINLISKEMDETQQYYSRRDSEGFPTSLYRMQFNKNFTFKDAMQVIPYLNELGISHCYASPILHARADSTHGYDIINHSELNPEIGSLHDFNDFVNTLHHYDMGLIVDIVPNHMAIGKENLWWMDVLENGQASRFASFFDIDWAPSKKELKGKVLLPVLGDHYGNILTSGQLKFSFEHETGKLKLHYWDHEFPVNPSSYLIFLEHRINVLEARLGGNNPDFLEYLSIITQFRKIPGINESSPEKIAERNREKDIASGRLAALCRRNAAIEGFIQENLNDFQCKINDPLSCNRIHNLLEEQAYRLAYWRVSIDLINYRRFFDVNYFVGLKTENPLVFNCTHTLILDLIEQRKIDGLRIDHPDGLLNPTGYFIKLQAEAAKRLGVNFDPSQEELLGSQQLPVYIVAEKILAPFEKLPRNWAISGTVGYEFLNDLTRVLVNGDNSKRVSKIYERFIGKVIDFDELVIECKKIIMKTSLTSELSTLSNHLSRIFERYYSSRDYTLNNIRDALTEIIACFPVYRTYISPEDKNDKAEDYIKWAIGLAKKRTTYADPSIFDFIEKILIVEPDEEKDSPGYADILYFTMKFQQYTSPLMAKGLEDTSFYRYNRLIALNEVGGEPSIFDISVNDFHNNNIKRLEKTPCGLLNTSTHDTKRSEDARARICVLTEIPDKWHNLINKLSRINKFRKIKIDNVLSPDRNDEYLFYQTLLAIYPCKILSDAEKDDIMQRIERYMIKAMREAKVHTSWVNINSQYEEATIGYIRKILSSPDNHPFWKEFMPFLKEIAHVGALNSVFQVVLKLTCPGVPEIYQGSEVLKFTLVDPDNRNPVDYELLRQNFAEIRHSLNEPNNRADNWHEELLPLNSGRMKLFYTAAILNFRQKNKNLFRYGNYVPIEAEGVMKNHVIAFARHYGNECAIVVVPRCVYGMVTDSEPLPVGHKNWQDTKITLPNDFSEYSFKDIITGTRFENIGKSLNIGDILNKLPAAVLYAKRE